MPAPKKPRRAILKEELVILCGGDHVTAIVLERLLYKSRMAEEYAEMQESVGKHSSDIDEASRGWITTSASKLAKEVMLGVSQKTVRRRLSLLVSMSYLLEAPSSSKWTGAASYKVNIDKLQIDLFQRGFVLDGYGLPDIEETMAKKQGLPTEDPSVAWDVVPSASDSYIEQPKLPGIEHMGVWLTSQRLLTGAPNHIALTSYLLWKHGGFTPNGSKKSWYSACTGLWEAAKCNEHTLNTAIETGQSARSLRGLTLSGPRSFITFALDAAAQKELKGRGIQAGPEGRRDAAVGNMQGQTVSKTETGKTTIEIGRRNGQK